MNTPAAVRRYRRSAADQVPTVAAAADAELRGVAVARLTRRCQTASAEMKWINGWTAATFESEFSSVARSYAGKVVSRHKW
jgi:hypothetical protein